MQIVPVPDTFSITQWRRVTYFFFCLMACCLKAEASPLFRAHAHNDYLHRRPLFDALDHGFGSIEVDVFLVDGQLLVGHNRQDCDPEKTLEALYLKPLREHIERNDGWVYSHASNVPVILWIDLKIDSRLNKDNPQKAEAEAEKTFIAVQRKLKPYAKILTKFTFEKIETNALFVVLTGASPKRLMTEKGARYFTVEGKFSEMKKTISPDRMAFVCEDWRKFFEWRGEGEMPLAEKKHLRDMITQVHQQNRRIRFWGVSDNRNIWRKLLAANADIIGADNLDELEKFLRAP